jgi:hypothetical protein
MKLRFISEPRPEGRFLFSTECQYDGSEAWVYVSGSCASDEQIGRDLYENAARNLRDRGSPYATEFTVLDECTFVRGVS